MLVLAEENAAAPLQKKGPSLATRAFFCNGGEGERRKQEFVGHYNTRRTLIAFLVSMT